MRYVVMMVIDSEDTDPQNVQAKLVNEMGAHEDYHGDTVYVGLPLAVSDSVEVRGMARADMKAGWEEKS